MSTLYLRIPAKRSSGDATALVCQFAFGPIDTTVPLPKTAALADLGAQIKDADDVVMLLAASDVTLLRMAVPPLAERKLLAALPALVEDHLLSDPAKCAIAIDSTSSQMRTIAVTDKDWLETLTAALYKLGAKKVIASPFQSCLPNRSDTAVAIVEPHNTGVDVIVSVSGNTYTLLLPSDSKARSVLQVLKTLVPATPVSLFVPAEHISQYQETTIDDISVDELSWVPWARETVSGSPNLLSAQGLDIPVSNSWKPWRWPLALAASVLLVNIVGLQIDWLLLRQERQTLQESMQQAFSAAYPNEKVIVDPIAQMRQKIAAARSRIGQPNHDDFLALSAAFSEAWTSAAQARQLPAAPNDLASVEYRDRQLIIKWKKEISINPSDLKNSLAARNLFITSANGSWQIGGIK